MAEQLALAVDEPVSDVLRPGDWTPTGWGAQHRVRRSDERWTELVCHTALADDDRAFGRKAGDSSRCATDRINRGADETEHCANCSALPDLGPLRYGPIGEVRRSPDGLVVVASQDVCHPSRAGGTRWKVIGLDPVPGMYGWRSEWHVAAWEVVGAIPGFISEKPMKPARQRPIVDIELPADPETESEDA
jgi:hypothetical protein